MSVLDSKVGRRQVVKGVLLAGPTLAVAVRFGLGDGASAFPVKTDEVADFQDFTDILVASQQPFVYDLLIEIKPDNRVYLEVPRMEVGQGIMTTVAMMVADNLDVPFESMDVALSPAEPRRHTAQITGGSHNTRVLWDPVRIICAQMRSRLLTAGSEHLGVPVSTVRTEDGHVVATGGARVPYGQISGAAARITPAIVATPKKSSDYKIIGRPHVRENAREIVTGQMKYAMDLFPSKDFKPTVVAMAATHGATVVSIDDSEARQIPGVIAVTHIPGMPDYLIPEAVAVTADTFGIAEKAKDALKIQWSTGPMDHMSDTQIDDMLNGIIDQVTTPDLGGGIIDATFRWPYVSHAPMEENDSVADVKADSATIWGGAKVPIVAQRNIAETLGMKVDQVRFNVVPSGGSFGRRLFHDPHVHAAQVSQRLGLPVKLQWMREEGIKHGRSRPVSIHRVRATVLNGDVQTFEHRMACPEMDLRHGFGDVASGYLTEYSNEAVGQYFFTHSQKLPYKFGPTVMTLKQRLLAKPSGSWRNVYSGQVAAVNEMIVRELAEMLAQDEVDFRLKTLDSQRHRAVLEKVAHEGQWGRGLPAGVGQGIGMHDEYKSIVAYLMEIDVRGREPRMTRCTVAVDNGFCVNPTGTLSTLFGTAMDGFALVFRAGLHVDNGATRESNFHDFRWSRMFDSAPEMQGFILPDSNVLPGGLGELGLAAATAAAANAWARATGKRPRTFPLNEYGV